MKDKQHDIFISYSSEDKPVADAVCHALEENCITCWIAPRDVMPGITYARQIIQAIDHCQAMILIFSANSNLSPHVENEVDRAFNAGKPIISFIIDNAPMSDELNYYLGRKHWLIAYPDYREKTRELLVSVFRLLGKELPTESQEATNKPERKAEIHIKADANCTMLRFGTVLANLQANQDHVIHLMPGKHKFTFIATEDSSIKEERIYSLSPEILSDFIDIKIKQKIVNKIKREKEEKERQAEEELKRKEEEKKVKEEEEKNREEEKRIRTLIGHTDCVDSAAFSPDGSRIVSASNDETVKIWDTQTGECIRTLEGHTSRVHTAAFSPDGSRIVSASNDETVKIWDTQTGKCIRTLTGHTDSVWSAAFSPDGNSIASAGWWDRTIRIWNTETGKCIQILKKSLFNNKEGHTKAIAYAAFSPDGKRIASTSTNILIWDIVKGKIIKKLEGHTDAVWSAAFSPDGKRIVSASMDQTTRIWDVETGECVKILKGNVHSAAFSPDGKRIVSAGKYEARIWNAETGESIKRFHRKIGALRHLSFSPDGSKIAIASELHCIYILDISNL